MNSTATIAQANPTASRVDTGQVLLIIGLTVVVVTLAGLGIMWFRRRVLTPPPGAGELNQGFLDQLRTMRDRGEMSSEEYEAARRSMREKLRATLHAKTPGAAALETKPGTQRPDNDA